MSLFWRKKVKHDEPLIPGRCECGHSRCDHVAGNGECKAAFPADAEWPNGADCSCQIYIRDTRDIQELERMVKL
jgi:hypothetical protein